MSATLFDITGEFLALYELAADEGTENDQVFSDTLDGLTHELDVKSAGYVAVMNRLEAEEVKAKEISQIYSDVAKSRKNRIAKMKEALLTAMDAIGVTEMPAGDVTIKVKKNGGLQPLVIDRPEIIPDNMNKVIIEPDNTKIREFLKDNECDWAHLEERGRHIEIK